MRHPLRSLLLLACSFFVFTHAHATPTNNLALTCKIASGKCSAGWTWQKPVAGLSVITQGGSWRDWTPTNTSDVITLCSSAIEPGTARSSCKVIFFAISCNASGQTCNTTPPDVPVDTTANITWTNPTDSVLIGNTLYRGSKADGSDLVAYKDLPVSSSFTDTNLTPGTWCYALKAINDAGPSVMSNVKCKVIVAPEKIVPGPVSNVAVK